MLESRLTLSTTWPESAEAMDPATDASQAFDVLLGVLTGIRGKPTAMREVVDPDALHIWSTVHGLADLMNWPCVDRLGLKAGVLEGAAPSDGPNGGRTFGHSC